MRCLKPRTVGFAADGKTIVWSEKARSKQYPSFKLPDGKCIECRLEHGRSWAVRCVHEAHEFEENCFPTFTYAEDRLTSPRLLYEHYSDFMKRLRDDRFRQIGEERWLSLSKEEQKALVWEMRIPFKVVGEYGEQTKRPHWHALLFNYRPQDLVYAYSNERGDKVYRSESLEKLWGFGRVDVGNVSFESAAYVMRYAAKKLIHGLDQDHDFHPICRGSNHYAIGKSFLEKYYKNIFERGFVEINGEKCSIPRYYEKWLEREHFDMWVAYVTGVKQRRIAEAEEEARDEMSSKAEVDRDRASKKKLASISKGRVREIIVNDRFSRLQRYLKGDL